MPQDFEPGAKFERIAGNLVKPEVALRQIGVLMVAESHENFREQRMGNTPWKERRVPNVMGVIADFALGRREPLARRFEKRPVLRDTGRLMQSIAFAVKVDVVEVGTNLPYASVQHYGGTTESQPITEQVRTGLNAWLKGKGKPWRKALGFLLNSNLKGKRLQSHVPARPIVGITEQTIDDVHETVKVRILEAD